MHYNRKPRLTPWLIHQDFWDKGTGIFFVDVGCSGGLFELCPFFEGAGGLKAVGFDPLVDEIDRLKSGNKYPNIRYECAFVLDTLQKQKTKIEIKGGRISGEQAMSFETYHEANFVYGRSLKHTEKIITLDRYFFPNKKDTFKDTLDFLKIDTDSYDYFVLKGAEKLLQTEVLGIQTENNINQVNFLEGSSEKEFVLSKTHEFLLEKGLILFDWLPYRYSRGTLPDIFTKYIPAETFRGAIWWADLLYFRDLGEPNYEKEFPDFEITPQRILNLICLYELYYLNDCAVELVLKYRERFGFLKDPKILDLLTPSFRGKHLSYHEYMELFQRDYKNFYPSSHELKYSLKSTSEILEWVQEIKKLEDQQLSFTSIVQLLFRRMLQSVLIKMTILARYPKLIAFSDTLYRKLFGAGLIEKLKSLLGK